VISSPLIPSFIGQSSRRSSPVEARRPSPTIANRESGVSKTIEGSISLSFFLFSSGLRDLSSASSIGSKGKVMDSVLIPVVVVNGNIVCSSSKVVQLDKVVGHLGIIDSVRSKDVSTWVRESEAGLGPFCVVKPVRSASNRVHS